MRRWLAGLMLLATGSIALPAPAAEPRLLRDCAECPELVVVPAGRFSMGSPADAYEHDERSGEPLAVQIRRAFALGRFELQAWQFARFIAATGHRPAHACAADAAAAPAAPARCLTTVDATAYLAWLGERTGRDYRLPSESEWEYAARGGTPGARSWSGRDSHEGVSISRACDHGNVYDVSARGLGLPVPHARCTDGYPGLAPAGSFLPNPFGLYDLIGNVRERLADCFTRSYKGRPADERAWRWDGCTHDAVRGGTWRSRPAAARSAARDFVARDADAAGLEDVGLRVARDLDATELANDAR
jgi:formylglycine-generating enzyme required for sulfatase activity